MSFAFVVFLGTPCLIDWLNSVRLCELWWASPQGTILSQMARLRGLISPTSWNSFLLCVKYAHNSLVSVSTRMTLFMASMRYQPPLFKVQKEEVKVPSAQTNPQRYWTAWRQFWAALFPYSCQSQKQANCQRAPAPPYQPGHWASLSSKDLTSRWGHPIWTFRGGPSSLKVCPPFHVSLLKLLSESGLVLPSEAPSPPRDRWWSIIYRFTNFGGLPTRMCSTVPGRMEGLWSRGEVVAFYILGKDLVRDFYYDHTD